MESLFTIVYDPNYCGDWRLYDRIFYISSAVPLSRCDVLNNYKVFGGYKVVKVDFTFLDDLK